MANSTYTVQFYVNGHLTSRLEHLSPNEAYTQGVPGEALNQNVGSRWHLMLRTPALERLDSLLEGESLRVCWQTPSENNWSDNEHVIIVKEPLGIHIQAPPAVPVVPAAHSLMNNTYLLNDIQALINNMLVNQDNQQNLINNIRNRLVVINHNYNENNPSINGFQE